MPPHCLRLAFFAQSITPAQLEFVDRAREELIAWCAVRLGRFRVPELVELRAELPRTSVGKIQKHLLRAEHG